MQQRDTGRGSTNSAEPPTQMLRDKPNKWKNWWTRFILTVVMLGSFCFFVWLGPFFLTVLVLVLQLKCFQEIIDIGWAQYKERELPLFRSLSWYFLGCANYYFYGEGFGYYLSDFFGQEHTVVHMLIRHHRFFAFALYLIGFVTFVLSLRKGSYNFQFTQFGWTHLALLLIVTQSHFIIQNIYAGLCWFLTPTLLVICNDIMAYFFGFFFGKTPLIKLSPKKTWEGFIGAFFSTMLFGVLLANFFSQHDYFRCSVQRFSIDLHPELSCPVNPVFVPTEMPLPFFIVVPLKMIGFSVSTFVMRPMVLHTTVLAIFASLIAPFGGFFASGLKRAFKIKDFDDLIPGHGGITDRFDCQLGMAAFANVYFFSFIEMPNVNNIVSLIMALPVESRMEILQKLQALLVPAGGAAYLDPASSA